MNKFGKFAIAAIEFGGAALLLIEGVILALMGVCLLVVSIIDSKSMFDFIFGLTAVGACMFLASIIFSMFKSKKQ